MCFWTYWRCANAKNLVLFPTEFIPFPNCGEIFVDIGFRVFFFCIFLILCGTQPNNICPYVSRLTESRGKKPYEYAGEVNRVEKANKIESNTHQWTTFCRFVCVKKYDKFFSGSAPLVSGKLMKSTRTKEKLADYTESNVKFTQLLPSTLFFFFSSSCWCFCMYLVQSPLSFVLLPSFSHSLAAVCHICIFAHSNTWYFLLLLYSYSFFGILYFSLLIFCSLFVGLAAPMFW